MITVLPAENSVSINVTAFAFIYPMIQEMEYAIFYLAFASLVRRFVPMDGHHILKVVISKNNRN